MSEAEYRVRIERGFAHLGYNVWLSRIIQSNFNVRIEYLKAETNEWVTVPEGTVWPEPTFRWPAEILKAFGLALAENELTHKELVFSSKEMAAVKYHLEDMRALVFKEPPRPGVRSED